MLVYSNNSNSNNTEHVKFISYTGRYPNLCRGMLTLEIDGKEVKFGYNSDCDHTIFWRSGGNTWFTDNRRKDHVSHGEWQIKVDELPEEFKKYAAEIDEVFNANVPCGCCGGCL